MVRLNCEVEIGYQLSNGGAASRSSRSRAAVSLGKKAAPRVSGSRGGEASSREELFFIVSTAKNVDGTKYKIKGNISRVFSKFLSEGKVTIKFRDPAHDVSISKADPEKLRELINVLRLSPQDQKAVTLAPLLPTKMQDIERPRTKLVVKSRGDYPIKGFPSSLETLEAVAVSLHRVDLRILRLGSLRHLDLSNNAIRVLPDEMKEVQLLELRLAGNKLTEFPGVLCNGALAGSLRLLDLTRNCLTRLPPSFALFKALVQLKLDCNELCALPRTFGKMSSLKFFSASNNQLPALPPSFPRLALESLDLFGNPFRSGGLVRRCSDLSLPSLMELAGRAVKKHRISYDPYSLPVVLCHYLDAAKKCLCGTACFRSFLHHVALLDLHQVAATVTAVDKQGTTKVPVEAFLCSARCLRLWRV